MKRSLTLLIFLALVLAACSNGATSTDQVLTLKHGDQSTTYQLEQLKALPETDSTFNDVNYRGVALAALLQSAGIDPASLTSVKAVASDGFSAEYDPSLFMRPDVILAYSQVDGTLSAEDGAYRMVLPGQEGKMNVRQVVEIQALP
jgi:hypothetical protein